MAAMIDKKCKSCKKDITVRQASQAILDTIISAIIAQQIGFIQCRWMHSVQTKIID